MGGVIMGISFGGIVLLKEYAEIAFEICSAWENDGFLFNFLLVKGPGQWCAIFDDNMEWGNVDLYARNLSAQLQSIVLSVEYDDDEGVRFCLWQNHCCIGQHIPCDGLMEDRKVGDIKIFARALKTKQTIVRQVFKSQNVEECLKLMECLLQCQLWGITDFQGGVKVYEASSYTTEYLDKYLKKAICQNRIKTDNEYSITLKNKWEQTILEASFQNMFIFTRGDREQAIFVLEPTGELVEKMKLLPDKRFNGIDSNKLCGDNDLFGFMAYSEGKHLGEGQFVVYENDRLLCSFPDICEKGISEWYAYIPDKDHICMEGACYNARSGIKDWDFFSTEYLKKQNVLMKSWRVLPDGEILLQLENTELLTFLAVNLDGKNKPLFSIKRTESYNSYYWDITDDLLYVYQHSQREEQPDSLHLLDLKFNKIADYLVKNKFFFRRIVFDHKGQFLYGSSSKGIIRLDRSSGIENVYDIYAGKHIKMLGILPEDILAVSSGLDLILLDTSRDLKCVMKRRLKGYIERFWPFWHGKTLIIAKKESALQREDQNIYFYEIRKVK